MQLNLISFNIRFRDDSDGNSIQERAPRLKTVTAPYDADVLGFQEVTPLWEAPVAAQFGKDYEILLSYRHDGWDKEGNILLVRKEKYQCLKWGHFWLSDTPDVQSNGWDERNNHYRICQYAILKEKASGTCFAVMNTHFGFGDEGQIKSAELIAHRAKELSPYPTAVMGDFNMKPDAPAYAAMTRHFTDVNAATAKDPNFTYHGYHPERHDPAEGPIDFFFANSAVTPVDCVRITETVEGKFPSDHYGLCAVLELPKEV